MQRFLLIVLIAVVWWLEPARALAQTSGPATASRIRIVASLPATCTVGDVREIASTGRLYVCTAANLWSEVAAINAAGLLPLGGTSSSFSALKNIDGELWIRKADDSGFATFVSGFFTPVYNSALGASGGTTDSANSVMRSVMNKGDNGSQQITAAGQFSWGSTAGGNQRTEAADTGLARDSSGVVRVSTGAGGLGSLRAGTLNVQNNGANFTSLSGTIAGNFQNNNSGNASASYGLVGVAANNNAATTQAATGVYGLGNTSFNNVTSYGGFFVGQNNGSPDSAQLFGVYGSASAVATSTNNSAFGVYGAATLNGAESGTAWAGYFAGNVNITGSLAKGSGTFLIDHPLAAKRDQTNLYHGFVEAPRYDLIYRGRCTLVAGSCTVQIDAESRMTSGTFAALTQNAQAQLQNETGFTAVKPSAVAAGSFTITAQIPTTDTINWVVYAERADPFIRTVSNVDAQGRLVPEQPKPPVTAAEALRLDTLAVETVEAESAQPDTFTDRVLPELIGKTGFPIHAQATGQGAVPRQRVRTRRVRKTQP